MKAKDTIVEARRSKIKDYIETHPDELFSAGPLSVKFGVNRHYIQQDIKAVAKDLGGELECIRRKGYIWHPTRKMKMENHEGYNDPTAAVAIKNADESAYIPFAEGAVHESQKNDGSYEAIVIVSSFSGFSYVLTAHPAKSNSKGESNELYTFFIHENVKYFVDHRRLSSKPNKYIGQKLFDLNDETLAHIQKSIATMISDLGFTDEQVKRQCDIEEQLRLEKWEDQIAHRAVQLDNLQHDLETQKAEFEAEKKRVKDIDQSLDNREAMLDQREVELRKREEEEDDTIVFDLEVFSEGMKVIMSLGNGAYKQIVNPSPAQIKDILSHRIRAASPEVIIELVRMLNTDHESEERLKSWEDDLRSREAEIEQALEMATLKTKVEVYEKILFPRSLKDQVLNHMTSPAIINYRYDPEREKKNEELAKAILFGDGKEARAYDC